MKVHENSGFHVFRKFIFEEWAVDVLKREKENTQNIKKEKKTSFFANSYAAVDNLDIEICANIISATSISIDWKRKLMNAWFLNSRLQRIVRIGNNRLCTIDICDIQIYFLVRIAMCSE